MLAMNITKKENNSSYNSKKKNKILSYTLNKRCVRLVQWKVQNTVERHKIQINGKTFYGYGSET